MALSQVLKSGASLRITYRSHCTLCTQTQRNISIPVTNYASSELTSSKGRVSWLGLPSEGTQGRLGDQEHTFDYLVGWQIAATLSGVIVLKRRSDMLWWLPLYGQPNG